MLTAAINLVSAATARDFGGFCVVDIRTDAGVATIFLAPGVPAAKAEAIADAINAAVPK